MEKWELYCAEDDMTINHDVKVEFLLELHKKIYDPMFHFPCEFGAFFSVGDKMALLHHVNRFRLASVACSNCSTRG